MRTFAPTTISPFLGPALTKPARWFFPVVGEHPVVADCHSWRVQDKSNRFDEEFGIELYMEKLVDDGIEPVASLPYSSRSIGVTAEGAAAFSDGKLFTKPAHAAAVTLFKT